MKNRLQLICNALLLLTALIWGVAFVAQSVAADRVGPWNFVFCRFLIAAILLIPITRISGRTYRESNPDFQSKRKEWNLAIKGGACCGFFLGVASIMQQIGLSSTSVGKAGFITALYIILVPIFGLLLHQRPTRTVWISALIAVAGFYFIAIKSGSGFYIESGDFSLLLSAMLYSGQILSIDYFSSKVNPVLLSNLEFLFAAIVGFFGMIIFEGFEWEAVLEAAIPILYAGVFSSAVGYTLQIIAQRYTEPTVASLLMSMESVFSALAGWMILGQKMSYREIFGSGLVFIAVILAQLPNPKDNG